MKLYWNPRWPNTIYYLGPGEKGDPINQVYVLCQPIPFDLDNTRWDLTTWAPSRFKDEGFEYVGSL